MLHIAGCILRVGYLLVAYLLVPLLGGGASLLLRSWRFIVWRVGPHGCFPSGPPFSKHLHLSWSSVTFGGDPWEVAMVTPLFAFCPHLLIALLCCQLAPTLHFEYCLIDKSTAMIQMFTGGSFIRCECLIFATTTILPCDFLPLNGRNETRNHLVVRFQTFEGLKLLVSKTK